MPKEKRRSLNESKRTRQKKAEIKGSGGEERGKAKKKSKTRKGRNRAANYEAKGVQEMMKTGQRKRRKMAVIKSKKRGSEQKGEENGQNKVEEG